MNRELVLERLNTIKQMPGIDKPLEQGPEQDAIYKELDDFLLACIGETPEGYEPTEDDRNEVNEMLESRDTAEYIGKGSGCVQAAAAVRYALQTAGLPINGVRCKNWEPFVKKYKAALATA